MASGANMALVRICHETQATHSSIQLSNAASMPHKWAMVDHGRLWPESDLASTLASCSAAPIPGCALQYSLDAKKVGRICPQQARRRGASCGSSSLPANRGATGAPAQS
eukprot:8897428-Pyramimonas_sp.AAC.2